MAASPRKAALQPLQPQRQQQHPGARACKNSTAFSFEGCEARACQPGRSRMRGAARLCGSVCPHEAVTRASVHRKNRRVYHTIIPYRELGRLSHRERLGAPQAN